MRQFDFDKVFNEGVSYIFSVQQKNGSFLSLSSNDTKNFTDFISYQTTFSTSFILSCICGLKETSQIKIIKQKAASFLLSQKSKFWSWNYWMKESQEAKTMPYPDDLDDTSSALNAIFLYDAKIIDGEALAHIVNLLISLEIKEGGPYKTWLVDKNAKKVWRDVDLAVNSNIAYFLFLNEIEIPNLSKFIESKIKKLDFSSPYYPSSLPIIYFISRFYKGKLKEHMINFLLSKKLKNNSFGNSLYTALAISSFLNLGFSAEKLKPSIDYLLKSQKDGYWRTYGFCFDPTKNGKKYFSGSSVLTTSFCLEALEKYKKKVSVMSLSNNQSIQGDAIYNSILEEVNKRLSRFENSFKKIAIDFINKLTKNNNDKQILLLPYYFAKSLGKPRTRTVQGEISDKLLIQLGQANLFGWIAYTIYDNFLDEEGDPKTLSLANLALRETQNIFLNILPNNKNWQIFVQKTFDQIDAANYWEVTSCRDKTKLPNYGKYEKLAEKSLGHALGPLAILFLLGLDEKSSDAKNFLKFFKHYLIARQLNDDAHDFEKDYKMGHINPVVALLLQKATKVNVIPAKTGIQKISLHHLQKLFWEKVLDEISLIILQHVKMGKLALSKCSVIIDKSSFENMLTKYENIALKSLEEKKQTMKFLKAYKND